MKFVRGGKNGAVMRKTVKSVSREERLGESLSGDGGVGRGVETNVDGRQKTTGPFQVRGGGGKIHEE